MDYVPKPEAKKSVWNGGSVEYFERKLKELEAQNPQSLSKNKNKNDVPKALRKPKSYKQDTSKQTTIGSFFSASQSEDGTSNSSSEGKELEENVELEIKTEKIDPLEPECGSNEKDDKNVKMEVDQNHATNEDNLENLISKEHELKRQIEKLEQEEKEDDEDRKPAKENEIVNENGGATFRQPASTSLSTTTSLFKSKRTSHYIKDSKDKYRSHLIYTPPDNELENSSKDSMEGEDDVEAEKEPDDILSLLDKIENEKKKYELAKQKLKERKETKEKSSLSSSNQYVLNKDKDLPSARHSSHRDKVSSSAENSCNKDKSMSEEKSQYKPKNYSNNTHSCSNRSPPLPSNMPASKNSKDTKTKLQKDIDGKSSLKQNGPSTSSSSSALSASKHHKLQKEREAAQKQKNDVSKTVVDFLNPYYKRKIATKELFKILAKRITNRVIDGKLGK